MKRIRSSRAARYKIAAVATLSVGVLALGACGPVLAGSAAVVGTARITDQTLDKQVKEVTSALQIQESLNVSSVILSRLVTQQLIFGLAEQLRISTDPAQVRAFLDEQVQAAGGRERFEQALLQQGMPADQIEAAARARLLVSALGTQLLPEGDPQSQEVATAAAVTKFSSDVGTRISPRFGEWDAELLRIGPPPNDLSHPVRKASINPMESEPIR